MARWPDPDFCRSGVLKFTRTQLHQIGARDQRQHDVCGKAVFERFFHPQGIGGIHENTRVLRSDHRLNDVRQVVDVGEGFHTEENIVEGGLLACGFFGALNDWTTLVLFPKLDCQDSIHVPYRGLNRSFPNN